MLVWPRLSVVVISAPSACHPARCASVSVRHAWLLVVNAARTWLLRVGARLCRGDFLAKVTAVAIVRVGRVRRRNP